MDVARYKVQERHRTFSAEQLDNEIKKYNQSFKKLMERKEVKIIAKVYVRKLKVTYNKEREDYHLHFHVTIAVKKAILQIKIIT